MRLGSYSGSLSDTSTGYENNLYSWEWWNVVNDVDHDYTDLLFPLSGKVEEEGW